MYRSQNSRNRKQKFIRRRTPHSDSGKEDDYDSEEDQLTLPKKLKPIPAPTRQMVKAKPAKASEDKAQAQTHRLDKQARDEHNEQERSRRRELAIIYELIRCSFHEDDLRHLGNVNAPKSIEKLSYPQVLHIAYQILLEEHHNIELFEKTMADVKRLEKELSKCGLIVPARPPCTSMFDNYKKVFQIVDSLLKFDKASRTKDGLYEMTPADRAAHGDQQLNYSKKQSLTTSYHISDPYESYSAPSSTSQRAKKPIAQPVETRMINEEQESSRTTPTTTEANDEITIPDFIDSSFSLFDNYDCIFPEKLSAEGNFGLDDLEPLYPCLKLDPDSFPSL